AAGIPTWSPTVVLICRSTAYVWQSGRDAQFSADCGRMCLLPRIFTIYAFDNCRVSYSRRGSALCPLVSREDGCLHRISKPRSSGFCRSFNHNPSYYKLDNSVLSSPSKAIETEDLILT
ncbi:hypothetical protein KCU73_g6356, partial [Aureobasidium melanogenum]